MLRLVKFGWIVFVVVGGFALALVALLARDLGGAAVMTGIALTGALAAVFLPGGSASRRNRVFPVRKD